MVYPALPRNETAWARALRWIADRRRLTMLDDRLLRDIGLSRTDVEAGVAFRAADLHPARVGVARVLRRCSCQKRWIFPNQ